MDTNHKRVKEVVRKILKMDRLSRALVRTELESMLDYAKEDVKKINEYTPPEEAKARREAFEYYSAVVELLKMGRVKRRGKIK